MRSVCEYQDMYMCVEFKNGTCSTLKIMNLNLLNN